MKNKKNINHIIVKKKKKEFMELICIQWKKAGAEHVGGRGGSK